ncbi:hypothetical protein D3C73_1121350 [compost metagenome]
MVAPLSAVHQLLTWLCRQVVHFKIVQQLGIVRRIAVHRLYLQIVEAHMIVAAGQIYPSGQFRDRVGINSQLHAVEIRRYLIACDLDSKVMPGIVGGIESGDFNAAGPCRCIAAGYRAAVHQQLPAAVEPEFQHIWRAADRM